jgi:hypothetical protein
MTIAIVATLRYRLQSPSARRKAKEQEKAKERGREGKDIGMRWMISMTRWRMKLRRKKEA